jgi:hypothetical protein
MSIKQRQVEARREAFLSRAGSCCPAVSESSKEERDRINNLELFGEMKFISWNPAISNQYARYIPNQQLELVDIVEHTESRKPVVVESLPEKALSCFEWQYSCTNSLLAYGTSLGNLNVVDWKKHKEV